MNNIIIREEIKIEDLICKMRGKEVMLDSDLARLYSCKNGTKEINQAVKNNIEKFPERFSWKLTSEEFVNLKSKFLTSSWNTYGGRRKLPRVFTEEGVAMLATILKSKVAAQVSIAIMDAFVSMRKFIQNENLEYKYYKNMLLEHDKDIKLLKDTFANFKSFSNEIFYEGQTYDSYSLLIDIFNTSNKEIIIIDNYISKELLDILSKINRNIIIYTKHVDKVLIEKYNSQYHNIDIKINNSFHDRFIIIDNKILYHCGASFKDLGKKCFCISKIEDINILKGLINNLN